MCCWLKGAERADAMYPLVLMSVCGCEGGEVCAGNPYYVCICGEERFPTSAHPTRDIETLRKETSSLMRK